MDSVSEEKPYKCNQCGHSSRQKGNLKTHMKLHVSQEKPYKCNQCGYSARQKGNLESHIKLRHKINLRPQNPSLTLQMQHKCI